MSGTLNDFQGRMSLIRYVEIKKDHAIMSFGLPLLVGNIFSIKGSDVRYFVKRFVGHHVRGFKLEVRRVDRSDFNEADTINLGLFQYVYVDGYYHADEDCKTKK